MKKLYKILIFAICAVTLLFSSCAFSPSNSSKYDPSKCEAAITSLTGKTIYWLGSSVTLGMESWDVSMADYIAARNNATCVKEAISGTTLIDKKYKKHDSYVTRMQSGENFKKDEKIDAFICQISTNDAKESNKDEWGEITPVSVRSKASFDVKTTLGAMEYIIAYVEETWNCPVYFYSGTYFSDEGERSYKEVKGSDYKKLIDYTYEMAEKWNSIEGYEVKIIDLFNDEALNSITDKQFKEYMCDAVHPYKKGYLEWWTPAFESVLLKDFGS